jgi:hypothetical protein
MDWAVWPVPIQNYSADSWQDSLDEWSARRKVATYARKHKTRKIIDVHLCLYQDSNPPCQCSREQRLVVPETALPLWPAQVLANIQISYYHSFVGLKMHGLLSPLLTYPRLMMPKREMFTFLSWGIWIATGYGQDDRGFGVPVTLSSRIFFSPCLVDWLCGLPSFISSGYQRIFPRGLGGRSVKREAHHSPPANAESRKCGCIHPLPHTPSWRSAN